MSRTSAVERCLLLRRRKRPCRAGAALLAKDQAHLGRRLQLGLMRTERRTGLGELERAQEVAPEITLVTTHFGQRTSARRSRHCSTDPRPSSGTKDARHQSTGASAVQEPRGALLANRREKRIRAPRKHRGASAKTPRRSPSERQAHLPHSATRGSGERSSGRSRPAARAKEGALDARARAGRRVTGAASRRGRPRRRGARARAVIMSGGCGFSLRERAASWARC